MSAARDARSLFAAARADGPHDDVREDMFRRVALVTGVAGAAAAASSAPAAASTAPAAAKTAGSAISLKLLAIGGAIGAAGTALGVLLALTVVAPSSSSGAKSSAADRHDPPIFMGENGSVRVRAPTVGAKLAQPAPRTRDTSEEIAPVITHGSTVASDTRAALPSSSVGAAASNHESELAEEARLVTEARRALVGGDPAKALSMVQATRKLGSRSMEPEELGLEARALRALGRADDAAATELVLRRRFPDHALAR